MCALPRIDEEDVNAATEDYDVLIKNLGERIKRQAPKPLDRSASNTDGRSIMIIYG
jgi:hypothetical protein